MTLFQAVVLGVVQGLSEFLPISSSAHLILVPWLLGWPEHTLTFDLALHLGTSAALLVYFWREWIRLGQAVVLGFGDAKRRASPEWRLAWLIALGCLPAGIMGVLFEDVVEEAFRNPVLIGILLIGFGALLLLSDRLGSKLRPISHLWLPDALYIGCAQVLALAPGVSRSGVTITAGLFRGLDRAAAARFSFLLSAPITIAAALYKLRVLLKTPPTEPEALVMIVGIVTAGVVGAFAIGFMLRYLQRQSVAVFFWYRLVLGVVVIALALAGH